MHDKASLFYLFMYVTQWRAQTFKGRGEGKKDTQPVVAAEDGTKFCIFSKSLSTLERAHERRRCLPLSLPSQKSHLTALVF